jgi:TolB-like protein/class 3 adenylate cyclase
MKTERRLAAIMFTDIQGYTALTQENEILAVELLESHFQMLRPIITAHNGIEIKTVGDAFLIEYGSTLQALQSAVKMQAILLGHNACQPPDRRILVRIGIHIGDIEHRDGDIFGDGVNIASRIQSCAQPGGILITQQVYDQIGNKTGLHLSSIGKQQLKNIEKELELYAVELPWTDIEAIPDDRATTSIADKDKSIAVLPLQNLSSDEENEYFSEGITEDIITQLSKIQDLKVISRTSSLLYKNSKKNIREIGRELGVGSILEGSVRKSDDKVRITAQLINTRNDVHLWAETYDRQLSNIFEIQNDVAEKIAQALKVYISPSERERIQKNATDKLDAYNLYLQGRYLWNRRTEDGYKQAINYFEHALIADPDYALAHAGLADAYSKIAAYGFLDFEAGFNKARKAIDEALRLDDMLAEAYVSRGAMRRDYDWDWAGADEDLKRAIGLAPTHAAAHHEYAYYLNDIGQFSEAICEMERACELDPLSLMTNKDFALILFYARRYDEAIEHVLRVIDQDPEYPGGHATLGHAYYHQDRLSEAISAFRLETNPIYASQGLALAYSKLGAETEAQEHLHTLVEIGSIAAPYQIAEVFCARSELVEGFQWLEKGFELRDSGMQYLGISPSFDLVRDNPQFGQLLERMGLSAFFCLST